MQVAGPSTSTAAPRLPGTSTPPSRGGSSGSPGTPGSAPGSSPSVLTTSESINKPRVDNVQHLKVRILKISRTRHFQPHKLFMQHRVAVSSCLKVWSLNSWSQENRKKGYPFEVHLMQWKYGYPFKNAQNFGKCAFGESVFRIMKCWCQGSNTRSHIHIMDIYWYPN